MAQKILAMTLCLMLLGGCASISMNAEDLLVPPRLNKRQTMVEEALQATVSPSSILYRYPQRGDYRSPFVFFDMDNDGLQEAMVFYTYRSGDDMVRAKVLRETKDGFFQQVRDITGDGDQVDFIQFAHVLDRQTYCLLIGWQNTRKGSSTLGVYTYQGGDWAREAQMSYESLDVDDYLGDGLNEVLLIRKDSSDYYQLTLLGRTVDGRLSTIGELPLSPDTTSVLQMCRGRLEDGYAVYIDQRRADTYTGTEVVSVGRNGLQSLVGELNFELYSETFREEEVLSVDLQEDGSVEIPTLSELPGYVTGDELEPPPLTDYIRLSASADQPGYSFQRVYSAAVNEEAGYLVFFPERWVGNVTIQRRPESNEWRFYKVDPVTDFATTELLRIGVYSTRDYQDQFTSNYIPLAERGLFQYKAYIPATEGEPLAITQRELETQLFMLL